MTRVIFDSSLVTDPMKITTMKITLNAPLLPAQDPELTSLDLNKTSSDLELGRRPELKSVETHQVMKYIVLFFEPVHLGGGGDLGVRRVK